MLALSLVTAPGAETDSALRAHVRPLNDAIEPLLDALLAHVLVVDGGWERAADSALQHPNAVVVTREGDRFSSAGWRVGAARSQLTVAALDEARSRAAAAGERASAAAARVAANTLALESAQRECAAIERQLEDNDSRLNAAADGLARVQAAQREVETEAEALRTHHAGARRVGGRRAHPHYRARAGPAGSRGRRGS